MTDWPRPGDDRLEHWRTPRGDLVFVAENLHQAMLNQGCQLLPETVGRWQDFAAQQGLLHKWQGIDNRSVWWPVAAYPVNPHPTVWESDPVAPYPAWGSGGGGEPAPSLAPALEPVTPALDPSPLLEDDAGA